MKNLITKAANGIKMRNYRSRPMPKSYTKTGQHDGKQFPLFLNDAPQPSIMQQALINAVLR